MRTLRAPMRKIVWVCAPCIAAAVLAADVQAQQRPDFSGEWTVAAEPRDAQRGRAQAPPIEFGSGWGGLLSLDLSRPLAQALAVRMFGRDAEELESGDMPNAVGELTSMVAGGINSWLSEPAQLSLPAVTADPARDYPNRPIRLVMGNAPGSATDTIGRIVSERLAATLGQPIVVDNRVGAGGTLGMEIGKNAKPDGYTLIVASLGALTVSPHIRKNLPYDPIKDFEYVVLYARQGNVLVVNPSLPIKGVKDLIGGGGNADLAIDREELFGDGLHAATRAAPSLGAMQEKGERRHAGTPAQGVKVRP